MYSEHCLALFDFDDTIVDCDSFEEFVRFTHEPKELRKAYAQLTGKFAAYRFGRLSRQELREALIGRLYADYTEERLREVGKDFAFRVLVKRIRPKAFEQLRVHRNEKHRLAIVSSSLDVWLKPWAGKMGMELICSELAYEGGKPVGKYATPECLGEEKVRRIKERFVLEQFERVYAYGHSKSDSPMLKLADEPNFRVF